LPAEGLGPAAAAGAAGAAHGVQEAVQGRISPPPIAAASAAARSTGGQHSPVKDEQQAA
jgi:hypothetical protein